MLKSLKTFSTVVSIFATGVSTVLAADRLVNIQEQLRWTNQVQQKVEAFNQQFAGRQREAPQMIDLSDVSYSRKHKFHPKAVEIIQHYRDTFTIIKAQKELIEENRQNIRLKQALLPKTPSIRPLTAEQTAARRDVALLIQLLINDEKILRADLATLETQQELFRVTLEKYEQDVKNPKIIKHAEMLWLMQVNPADLTQQINAQLRPVRSCSAQRQVHPSGVNPDSDPRTHRFYRKDGKDLFMLAAERGDRALVTALMKAGANPVSEDDQGNSAITLASKHLHYTIVEDILNFYQPRTRMQKLQALFRGPIVVKPLDLSKKLGLTEPRYQLEGNCYAHALSNIANGYRSKFSTKPVKPLSPILFSFQYEHARNAENNFLKAQIDEKLTDPNIGIMEERHLRTSRRILNERLAKDLLNQGGDVVELLNSMQIHPLSLENFRAKKAPVAEPSVRVELATKPKPLFEYLGSIYSGMKGEDNIEPAIKNIAERLKRILENDYKISLTENTIRSMVISSINSARSAVQFADQIFESIEIELNRMNRSTFAFGTMPPVVQRAIRNKQELEDLFSREWNTMELQNPIYLVVDSKFLVTGPGTRSTSAHGDHAITGLGFSDEDGQRFIRVQNPHECRFMHPKFRCKNGLMWIDIDTLAANTFAAAVIDPAAVRKKAKLRRPI